MIPRIIHYCWLSSEIPDVIHQTVNKWKTVLPNYEFVLWDFSRFPRGKSLWVDQAFNSKKFAFAADYIRLYALYNYGGIYLDTDVEIIKPFDDLLSFPYFIGQEKTPSGIEAATMGFPPSHPLIKQLLNRYEARAFIKNDGTYDMEPIPCIIRRYIDSQYKYNVISAIDDYSDNPEFFNVFAADYFSPKRYDTGEIEITANTYSIHNFAGSWLPQKQLLKRPPTKERIKRWLLHHMLLRKEIVLVSNTLDDYRLSTKFALKNIGPLVHSILSSEDFEKLTRRPDLFIENNIHFIKITDSKEKEKITEYYPIALVGTTDIEIHFTECYSRSQALNIWNNGVQNIRRYKTVVLFDYVSKTRLYDYLTCMKLNLGWYSIR